MRVALALEFTLGCIDKPDIQSNQWGRKNTAIVEKLLCQELVSGGVYALDASIPQQVPAGDLFPMTQVLSDCINRMRKLQSGRSMRAGRTLVVRKILPGSKVLSENLQRVRAT